MVADLMSVQMVEVCGHRVEGRGSHGICTETLISFPSLGGTLDWKTGLHTKWCIWVSTKCWTLWTPKSVHSKTSVLSPPEDSSGDILRAPASACPVPTLSPLNLVVLALCRFPKGQDLIKLNSDEYKVLSFSLKNQLHTSNARETRFTRNGI